MNRHATKLSLAALAGASCLLSAYSARAAVTITETRMGYVTFANGTYDVVVLDVSAMTGLDATPGNNAGHIQDPQILALSGTFNLSYGVMAMIGATTAKQASNFLSTAGSAYGGPGTVHSSYMAFPSDTGATITEAGSSSKTSGNASSITDSWYVTPGTGNGNVGGVEPGKDPQNLTVANGGSDPYANNGMLAEFLVSPGALVYFTGSYSDYGYPGGNSITNVPPPPPPPPPPPSLQGIISLFTGAAPVGTPPYGYGSAPVGPTLNVHTGTAAFDNFPSPGVTTGYVAVTGENPSSSTELYALRLDLNGVPILPTDTTDLDKIIADIDGNNAYASASLLTSSPYRGAFPPGYDLLITTSAGSANPYFAWDFSNSGTDTTDPDTAVGDVTVTGIAAVPEPAGAAGMVLGAIGLLRGRRHRPPSPRRGRCAWLGVEDIIESDPLNRSVPLS